MQKVENIHIIHEKIISLDYFIKIAEENLLKIPLNKFFSTNSLISPSSDQYRR